MSVEFLVTFEVPNFARTTVCVRSIVCRVFGVSVHEDNDDDVDDSSDKGIIQTLDDALVGAEEFVANVVEEGGNLASSSHLVDSVKSVTGDCTELL